MAKKIATFSERHPIYRCVVCKKQTRCTDEMNYGDAEFNGLCSTCWDIGTLENEHEFWTNMPLDFDHPNQADCPECKEVEQRGF